MAACDLCFKSHQLSVFANLGHEIVVAPPSKKEKIYDLILLNSLKQFQRDRFCFSLLASFCRNWTFSPVKFVMFGKKKHLDLNDP